MASLNVGSPEGKQQLVDIELLASPAHKDSNAAIKQVMDYLKSVRTDFYWVGVYVLKGDELHVGPYNGPVTDHVRIPVGRGVCGTAVAENRNQRVDDVSSLDNYLACNLNTRSEIVVLVRDSDDSILGQIDIDSTKIKAFSRDDEVFLEHVAAMIAPHMKKLHYSISDK